MALSILILLFLKLKVGIYIKLLLQLLQLLLAFDSSYLISYIINLHKSAANQLTHDGISTHALMAARRT